MTVVSHMIVSRRGDNLHEVRERLNLQLAFICCIGESGKRLAAHTLKLIYYSFMPTPHPRGKRGLVNLVCFLGLVGSVVVLGDNKKCHHGYCHNLPSALVVHWVQVVY